MTEYDAWVFSVESTPNGNKVGLQIETDDIEWIRENLGETIKITIKK